MKVKHNVTLYKCDYCRATRQVKSAMEKHEKNCTGNPANQTCCSICDFLENTKENYEIQVGIDEFETIETTGFWCSKLKKELYPHKVIRLGLLEKYPDQFEGKELMPRECSHIQINSIPLSKYPDEKDNILM